MFPPTQSLRSTPKRPPTSPNLPPSPSLPDGLGITHNASCDDEIKYTATLAPVDQSKVSLYLL